MFPRFQPGPHIITTPPTGEHPRLSSNKEITDKKTLLNLVNKNNWALQKQDNHRYCSKDLIDLTSNLILSYDKLFNQLNSYEKTMVENCILNGINQLFLELRCGYKKPEVISDIEDVLELARAVICEGKLTETEFVLDK